MNLEQLTSLVEVQKALEAHGRKLCVTYLSIVPNTLDILTANVTRCLLFLEYMYVNESQVRTHTHTYTYTYYTMLGVLANHAGYTVRVYLQEWCVLDKDVPDSRIGVPAREEEVVGEKKHDSSSNWIMAMKC